MIDQQVQSKEFNTNVNKVITHDDIMLIKIHYQEHEQMMSYLI